MMIRSAVLASIVSSVVAFQQAPAFVPQHATTTCLGMGFDQSGNSWKPDSEKMGSTDTGDYFPEGYDPKEQIGFMDGMMGSQELLTSRDRGGPQLPGLENLGADAVVAGGINMNPDIPDDMEFIPSSVPDGEVKMNVAASGSGETVTIEVKPVCMTFEDYYAGFSASSDPCFAVAPATGRMDRRGGEPTVLQVRCEPNGKSGELQADLVINLPEDNSKICYKITSTSF